MNGLLSAFEVSPYPTAILTALPGDANVVRYDRSGRYIAGASPIGVCHIWDLDTKSPVRKLPGHVKAITCIDWSRNSRFVLTAGKDWNVVLWDLAEAAYEVKRYSTIHFDSVVQFAMFHPRNINIIVVLLEVGEIWIHDQRSPEPRTELLEPAQDDEEYVPPNFTCARFDPTGRYVFAGTSQSTVLVFNTRTKQLVCRYRISASGSLKGFCFAKYGRRLLTNSSDRILRQFNLPASYPQEPETDENPEQELEPTYRFSDPISRVAWHNMAYSPDGEWVAGGSADPATHKIFLWSIQNDGQLVQVLDGGREPLLDMSWHPKEAALASTTRLGDILLWHHPVPERWGAFAGGFEEFDENVEYEEREDEFDLEDEEEAAERKKRDEDVEVDISTKPEVVDIRELEMAREVKDEDILWAESDPDPDDDKNWRMKVVFLPNPNYM